LETPAVEHAFDTLARLVRERFGDRVHIVSKCGGHIEAKTKLWLEHYRFAELTGIDGERLHFCRKREDKAPICTSLGVTHFIDDRFDVLSYMRDVPRLYLFRPREKDLARSTRETLAGLSVVQSWPEIANDLL
jgi:hypothetical protein